MSSGFRFGLKSKNEKTFQVGLGGFPASIVLKGNKKSPSKTTSLEEEIFRF
jgi:hypothetical protein